ncbi:serine hydrolase FSH [Trichoderma sp. SZMC 28014]
MTYNQLDNDDSTIHLPRILCLHGGGTNARIFHAQCRNIRAALQNDFRLVFAEAAFSSSAGPDVLSVYKDWGPFKRWLRWLPSHPNLGPDEIINQLDQSLQDAMVVDDMRGATGQWVGLLGFSQGAKVSASLLYRQQMQEKMYGRGNASTDFKFGVIIAGRAPLVCLDPDGEPDAYLPDASQITDVKGPKRPALHNGGNMLRIPTLHVHGTKDPGLDLHQQLYEDFCEPDSRRLVVWDGDHRLPLKKNDVGMVVHEIQELAKGILEYSY